MDRLVAIARLRDWDAGLMEYLTPTGEWSLERHDAAEFPSEAAARKEAGRIGVHPLWLTWSQPGISIMCTYEDVGDAVIEAMTKTP